MLNTPHLRSVAGARPRCKAPAMHSECSCPSPRSGGQVGDSRTLVRATGERIGIADTRKGDSPDSVIHVPGAAMPTPDIGETLALEVDWTRRHALMRLH